MWRISIFDTVSLVLSYCEIYAYNHHENRRKIRDGRYSRWNVRDTRFLEDAHTIHCLSYFRRLSVRGSGQFQDNILCGRRKFTAFLSLGFRASASSSFRSYVNPRTRVHICTSRFTRGTLTLFHRNCFARYACGYTWFRSSNLLSAFRGMYFPWIRRNGTPTRNMFYVTCQSVSWIRHRSRFQFRENFPFASSLKIFIIA